MDFECACIDLDCDERAVYSKTKVLVEQRVRRCGECKGTIPVGDVRELSIVKWEEGGLYEAHRTCLACTSIRNEFFCGGWEIGGVHTHVRESLKYNEGQVASDVMLRLTPEARDKVFAMIEDVWADIEEDEP